MDHPLKQWPTERKRREGGNTKTWISWEQKELFGRNKKGLSFGEKIKNSRHKLQKVSSGSNLPTSFKSICNTAGKKI